LACLAGSGDAVGQGKLVNTRHDAELYCPDLAAQLLVLFEQLLHLRLFVLMLSVCCFNFLLILSLSKVGL
jgi:hypothetical protein